MKEKAVLQFDLLGTFACREIKDGQAAGSIIPKKMGKKVLSFLQYLIVNHNRNISAEELIEQFWPETDSSNPCKSVRILLRLPQVRRKDSMQNIPEESKQDFPGTETWSLISALF